MPEPCPECRVSKHQNCDGHTWDPDLDREDDCPCYMSDPEREEHH